MIFGHAFFIQYESRPFSELSISYSLIRTGRFCVTRGCSRGWGRFQYLNMCVETVNIQSHNTPGYVAPRGALRHPLMQDFLVKLSVNIDQGSSSKVELNGAFLTKHTVRTSSVQGIAERIKIFANVSSPDKCSPCRNFGYSTAETGTERHKMLTLEALGGRSFYHPFLSAHGVGATNSDPRRINPI